MSNFYCPIKFVITRKESCRNLLPCLPAKVIPTSLADGVYMPKNLDVNLRITKDVTFRRATLKLTRCQYDSVIISIVKIEYKLSYVVIKIRC